MTIALQGSLWLPPWFSQETIEQVRAEAVVMGIMSTKTAGALVGRHVQTGGSMHIKILRGVQVEGKVLKPGATIEVHEGTGRMLIASGKAEETSAPKAKPKKEVPSE